MTNAEIFQDVDNVRAQIHAATDKDTIARLRAELNVILDGMTVEQLRAYSAYRKAARKLRRKA